MAGVANRPALQWRQYSGNASDMIYVEYLDFSTYDEYVFTPKGSGINAGPLISADGIIIDNITGQNIVTVSINGLIENVPPFTKQVLRLLGANQVSVKGTDIVLCQFYAGQYSGSPFASNYYASSLQANLMAATGIISMWPGQPANIPNGYLLCDGGAYSRTGYASLFGKIGTIWGPGDGSTTFNVPNLVNKSPRGVNTASGILLGTTGGLDTVILTQGQMPRHTHLATMQSTGNIPIAFLSNPLSFNVGGGTWRIPAPVASDGIVPGEIYVPSFTPAMTGGQTAFAGNDQAHENWPPYAAMYFIIKT